MSKILWLASYPKSGNTWLRVLLTNYLRDAETPADINTLDGGPIASSRVLFDEWAGIEASAFEDAQIDRLRPEVYRCVAQELSEMLPIKTHDAWTRTDQGDPLFPADITRGVLYILRNPLDLLSSCAHHWGVSREEQAERLCDPNFALARSLGGAADQLRQTLGSWSGHAQSWLDESGLPIHLVRYEDLRQHPEDTFRDIVAFCGLPYDTGRVHKAVAFSDFKEMQRQEDQSGFRERLISTPGRFFRRGQSGSWRNELSPALVSKIIAAHGPMMRRFGYLDASDNPI